MVILTTTHDTIRSTWQALGIAVDLP